VTQPARTARRPLRWRHAGIFAAVVGATIFAIAWAPVVLQAFHDQSEREAQAPQPLVATAAEQVALVRALLAQHEFEGLPPPPPERGDPPRAHVRRWPVLLDRTLETCGEQGALRHACDDDTFATSPDYLPEVPARLRRELLVANRASLPLPDPRVPGVHFGPQEAGDAWEDFYARHPGSAGRLTVSRAVLSQDGREALLALENICGGTCGIVAVAWFVREGPHWRLAEVVVLGRY
jgi:hypothetical protein